MNIEDSQFKRAIITEQIKCSKAVIVLSSTLNNIYDNVQHLQHLIYNIGSYPTRDLIYTNLFNVFIDTVFRVLHKFDDILTTLTTTHNIHEIIILNDMGSIVEAPVKQPHMKYIHDIKTNKTYRFTFFIKLLIRSFQKSLKWLDHDDENLYNVERYLSSVNPAEYTFSVDRLTTFYKLNPMPQNDENTVKRKSNIRELICRLIMFQNSIISTKQVKRVILSFIVKHLSYLFQFNKHKRENKITMFNIDTFDVELFGLFPTERVIFVHDKIVKRRGLFILWNNKLYYTQLLKQLNEYLFIGQNLLNEQTVVTKYPKPDFIELLQACEKMSYFGVFDTNANYRYTVFENIQRLIVSNQIETMLPPFIEDEDVSFVPIDDMTEQLPTLIAQYNELNRFVKL